MRYSMYFLMLFAPMLLGCNGTTKPTAKVVFNELVSSNDGVSIDEEGQTEDWLELANTTDEDITLKGYSISDSDNERFSLPDLVIKAKSVLVFWADDENARPSLRDLVRSGCGRSDCLRPVRRADPVCD